MQKVLIIEDHKDFQTAIKNALINIGLEIEIASDSKEGMEKLRSIRFDLVILDLHLPDRSGFDIFNEMQNIEACQNVPVIFVTGASGISEKVTAFSLGADDYIVKPFNSIELKARVQSKLNKSMLAKQKQELLSQGDLTINLLTHQVNLTSQGEMKDISLTPFEYKLIVHFLSFPELVFSRDQLIDKILGNNSSASDRVVDFHVHGLRKKLLHMGKCIETIPGEGYRFVPLTEPTSRSA